MKHTLKNKSIMFKVFGKVTAKPFVDASCLYCVHTGCITHNRVYFFIFLPLASVIAWKTFSLLTVILAKKLLLQLFFSFLSLHLYTKTAQQTCICLIHLLFFHHTVMQLQIISVIDFEFRGFRGF